MVLVETGISPEHNFAEAAKIAEVAFAAAIAAREKSNELACRYIPRTDLTIRRDQ
jgi:hypothetical protein